VGKHRPLVSTGRFGGQLEHWLNALPEQVAQSGWHFTQLFDELNESEGHELTHVPFDASLLLAQVRQKFAEPAQVEQDESQAEQVNPSEPTKVPVGQDSTHFPLLKK
jgi:hypothetical protein